MTSSETSPDLGTTSGLPLRRRKRKDYSLLVLAAGLLLFAAAAGALYFALRPVTLRIAVGPPGSDDQKLIGALAQTFTHDGSSVRLAPITTEGATESIALLAASKADLAVARGDLPLPANAESVAILRKNVVFWVTFRPSTLGGAKITGTENMADAISPDIASASSAGRRPMSPCCG
jgi:hypothetical protein